ncbi:hypothetical protein ACS0TY_002211 [Phlomoides rotata]
MFLEDYREHGFDKAMSEAKKIASQMGIESIFPKKCIVQRKKQFDESGIDQAHSSIKIRLTQLKSMKKLLGFCSIWRGYMILMMKEIDSCFPNEYIVYKILLTIPVTVASVEKSFSKLKLIKTFLRSTISQDRLNELAMLSIEKDMTVQINYTYVINVFATKIVRRIVFK